ncbi:hypothetical protein GASC598B02_005770, partial [Gilliamella apicola SCGC AB-598-B02]
ELTAYLYNDEVNDNPLRMEIQKQSINPLY